MFSPRAGLPARISAGVRLSLMGEELSLMGPNRGWSISVNIFNVTGEGQYVDVALVDSVAASLEQAWQRYFVSCSSPAGKR